MSDASRDKNQYTLTWEIEDINFYRLRCFNSWRIKSPLFIADNLGRSAWFLSIECCPFGVDERAMCSLVRYAEDEGAEQILIQSALSVIFVDDGFSVSNVDASSSVINFKKGTSSRLCNFVQNSGKDIYLKKLLLKCQMTEYSTAENPISSGSTVQTNFHYIDWLPESFSDVKLLSCSQGVQYKVFFHAINGTENITIQRADRNSSIKCYMSCRLLSEYFVSLLVTGENTWRNPFNINDTKSMKSKSINIGMITGVIVTSFETNVQSSKPEGKLAEINTGHELDTVDIWRKEQLRMYEDGMHSDVKLQIGSKSIPAHKNVLASRSPVFSAMFEGGMVEQQTGVVDITDMDASTLDALLKYMYGAVVEGLEYEKALKLLVAADKYQVMSLKEKCASHLVECLSAENVCEVLALADLVSQPALKSKAVDYVKAHAKEVLLSDSWKQFVRNNVNLAAEIVILISAECGQKE